MSAAILSTLATTAPQLSCAIGTPERAIIDAVSSQIASAYISQYLTGGMMDINTLSGLQLDQYCLVPETLVITPRGPVHIESLKVGDEVLSHTGKARKVLKTFGRMVDEDLVTIRTAVGVEHTMTKNHPVLVTKKSSIVLLASQVGNFRNNSTKYRGKHHQNQHKAFRLRGLGSRTVWDKESITREWISAGDIELGDIVWGPHPGGAGTENNISVEEKRLIGYYLSEGHALVRHRNMSDIGFAFHENETSYQNEVADLLKSEWGVTHTNIAPGGRGKCKQVKCYDYRLALRLMDLYGKGAENKHIDWETFNSEEDLTPIVATYWNGDGTASKDTQRLSAKTVSAALAHQIFTICQRMGLALRLVMDPSKEVQILDNPKPTQTKDTWCLYLNADSALVLSEATGFPLQHRNTMPSKAPVSFEHDGFIGSAVVSVKEKLYSGAVHNIEVEEENSYLLMGNFAVHNCGQFGFGRLQGSAATGVITVTLSSVSSQAVSIPLNSQFYTTPGLAGLSTTLYFGATQAVTIPAGSATVSVPVQCTTVGTTGNVPPDSVTSQSAAIGASVCTNSAAMTGGTNTETDAQLRQRFIDTFLRNISGTPDWYINLALQNNNVARAAVYGPVSLYATQITVPETTLSMSVGSDVKYIWPGQATCYVGIGTSDETFYDPTYDYTLSSGAPPPVFTYVSDGALIIGQIVNVEFQYTTACSRNDPANSITNKVDVFVDGVSPFAVTETTVITSTTLSSSSSSTLYTGNFARVGATGSPSDTNRFMRLGSNPIIASAFPATITVGEVVYSQNVNYYLLQGTTSLQGSQQEVAGIEWLSSGPSNGTQLVLNYSYNQVPQLLDAVMQSSKQICTDVLNHVADYQYITTCLTVEYSNNYAVSTTNSAIVNQLQIFYQALGFGTPVIFSQLEATIQQVLGVNAVHVTTEAENDSNYGIQVYAASTDEDPTSVETDDFVINDNQLCVYNNSIILQAPNIGNYGG